MVTRTRALSPFMALSLLLPLAGCELVESMLESKVSREMLEPKLAAWLVENKLEATEVTCPDNQKMEKGNKFECHCKIQGIDVPVMVEVTDPSDGTVEWAPKYLTIAHDKIEAGLLALPELAGRSLDIDCKTVMVSVPDSEWTCDVVDAAAEGQALVLTLQFTDGEGSYEWTLEPKP